MFNRVVYFKWMIKRISELMQHLESIISSIVKDPTKFSAIVIVMFTLLGWTTAWLQNTGQLCMFFASSFQGFALTIYGEVS